MRTTRCSFPKMRAPVSTWITAKKSAALANHALPAMPVENTDVIRSVQVDATLASTARDSTRYIPRMTAVPETPDGAGAPGLHPGRVVRRRRAERLRAGRSSTRRSRSSRRWRTKDIVLGDAGTAPCSSRAPARAATGRTATGGGIGPRLDGSGISLGVVEGDDRRRQLGHAGGLVKGADEADVLAYLNTILVSRPVRARTPRRGARVRRRRRAWPLAWPVRSGDIERSGSVRSIEARPRFALCSEARTLAARASSGRAQRQVLVGRDDRAERLRGTVEADRVPMRASAAGARRRRRPGSRPAADPPDPPHAAASSSEAGGDAGDSTRVMTPWSSECA